MSKIEFKPITLEDRSDIQQFTLRGVSQICDLAFSNLFGWSHRYCTHWAVVEDSLVISFKPTYCPHPAFLMPVCGCGDKFQAVIKRLISHTQEGGFPLTLMGVSPKCKEAIETFCPDLFAFKNDDGAKDYVYLREKLITLSGKSLQSKRNHINKFEKLYPDYTFEEVNERNLEGCLKLSHTWLEHTEADSSRLDEQIMIENCLLHRESLGLSTGVLSVEGKVIAFTFGSPINGDTFGIHVEKADTTYEGAFTMINREFARHIPEQYRYINREEDLGIEGLRKSKLSYKPELMLTKYTAYASSHIG